MVVLEPVRVGALAGSFDLYEADKGVTHVHRIIGAGFECRERRFADGNDVTHLEEEDLRHVCDQGFQRCPELVLRCADRSLAGEFRFEGYAEAGETGDISYGFAKYLRDGLPNASFIGFTDTPIEKEDVNTPAVFGDYIDIYDGTVKLAESGLGRSRVGRVNGRDDDASRPDLRRPSLPR
jgi:hypothetical protein